MNRAYLILFYKYFFTICIVPGAPPPWKGLKRATKLSPVCPQMLPKLNNSHNQISSGRYDQLKRLLNYLKDESEDCLFLNLYVPKWCKYLYDSIKYSQNNYVRFSSKQKQSSFYICKC